MSEASAEESQKEKLMNGIKKEVKHIMEESVMLKCVHEDSASVISLCANVDACLSFGLKRRALGLFKTSSTTALIQKLAKENEDANHVMAKVQAIEIAAGQKRTHSAGDSSSSLSKTSMSGLLEKTQSGSNLAAFTPKYQWIRIALFEKRLQKIMAHLVAESDKYYTKDSLVADQDYGPILSSLLVGPCAIEYTKVKPCSQLWTDIPANELVQRHKISSCGSSSSISSPPSSVSPRVKVMDGAFDAFPSTSSGSFNLAISPLHALKRSLTHTPSVSSGLTFDEKRLVPSQAREYVESLHQNLKDVLIYGKNNVKVQPNGHDTLLLGYLSLHQITTLVPNEASSSTISSSVLALKWTPNQLMNGNTTEEKSASWQKALYIDLSSILFLHCHQDGNEPGKLILVSSDGTQHPPIHFPNGGHMVQFLTCMESSVEAIKGKFDPPLSTVLEQETASQKTSQEAVSADAAKAKIKFPWYKKEVKVQSVEEANHVSPEEQHQPMTSSKVDWVFKVKVPTSSAEEEKVEGNNKKTSLAVPKPKLSGSREWLANLFSPSKSRSNSTTSADRSLELGEKGMEEEKIAIEVIEDDHGLEEEIDEANLQPETPKSCSKRKSPSEPISTMCSSMRRQIISRAFYGWLAHCRHLKTIRKHLGGLTFKGEPEIPDDLSWHNGITPEWWANIEWNLISENEDFRRAFEREVYLKIYLGGIEPSLRKEVWPYLLGHYKWIHLPDEKKEVDKKVRTQYEHKLSDWMAIEAIVRQKDRETTAANIAKISGAGSLERAGSMSSNQTFNISNEVFESIDEDVSSRTVSVDKISTITEATENSTSNSERSRGKLTSTHSEPGPGYSLFTSAIGGKKQRNSFSKKLAFFRDNINSDEGIDGLDDHGKKMEEEGNSSDTEGEDLVSEEEGSKKTTAVAENGLLSNGYHSNTSNATSEKEVKSVTYKVTTPSIDSGNPSECSPLKAEPDCEDLNVDIEHMENFEADLSVITQKINTLRVMTPVSSKENTSPCHSPASSEGGSFPQELIDNFALNLHRIDKDVQRCDRNHPYFNLTNLDKLRNIITTYVWDNLDVGYMQGMCDIVAPMLVVFDEEALTHSCFGFLMERMLCNFPNGNQMDENFANMRSLIQILDQTLYDTIQKNGDFSHFYFCYRWFLLDFKREFAYCDIYLVWETIWASRMVTSSHFYLFVAMALVENYRDIILDRNMDFTDIIKFFNEMAEKHDGKAILTIARELVHQLQSIIVDQ